MAARESKAVKNNLTVLPRAVYQYTKLCDVQNGKIVNVYGVVTYFRKPIQSRIGQYCMTVGITDPSLQNLPAPKCLNCVLFAKELDGLPKINTVGDVVRFHRLKIGEFNEAPQGKSGVGFSWVVFYGANPDATSLDDLFNMAHSHINCTFTDEDTETVIELLDWSKSKEAVAKAKEMTLIKDVKPDNKYINILCQVISVHPSLSDKTCTVIKVWDGTQVDYRMHHYCTFGFALDEPTDYLLALSRELYIYIHVYDMHAKNAELMKPGDFVQFINIHQKSIDSDLLIEAIDDNLMSQEFINFDNNWIALVLHGGTGLGREMQILDPENGAVQVVAQRIGKVAKQFREVMEKTTEKIKKPSNTDRELWPLDEDSMSQVYDSIETDAVIDDNDESQTPIIDTTPIRALQESCTIAAHPHIPFTTIQDIREYPRVPYKFRCRARVLQYDPMSADKILHVTCNHCDTSLPIVDYIESDDPRNSDFKCKNCAKDAIMEYNLYLMLEDDTDIVPCILCETDAEEFLSDFPVSEVLRNKTVRFELEARLLSMLGGDTTLNDDNLGQDISHRPYIECCIKSYHAICPEDASKNKICYRIFDTVLN